MDLEAYKDQLNKTCRLFNVRYLHAFGSILHKRETETHDIDLIVTFNNLFSKGIADRYFGLHESLESIFRKRVDLLEDSSIKNPVLKRVLDREKVLIYG